jgi:hypothetical protein
LEISLKYAISFREVHAFRNNANVNTTARFENLLNKIRLITLMKKQI